MKIYEVQKFGVTLEWSDSLRDAEDAFKEAANYGVSMYLIQAGKKVLLKSK